MIEAKGISKYYTVKKERIFSVQKSKLYVLLKI